MGWVRLGKVVRAVGLGGRVGVAGTEGALARVKRVELRRAGAAALDRLVRGAGPQGRVWWLELEDVAGRDAAESLVGCEVWGRREEMGEPGAGLHYWADLEGLPVVTAAGAELGRVEELYVTGGVDVLVVRGAGGERLVPLAPYVTVDRAAGRVVVDAPPGLLDREDEEARRTERNRT
jgi:16S rRNA processing protein RimM